MRAVIVGQDGQGESPLEKHVSLSGTHGRSYQGQLPRHSLPAAGGRRGKKRAAVAVARSMLVIAYHMLRNGTHYIELGADYFDNLNHQQLQRRLVKRLSQLGYQVTLQPVTT